MSDLSPMERRILDDMEKFAFSWDSSVPTSFDGLGIVTHEEIAARHGMSDVNVSFIETPQPPPYDQRPFLASLRAAHQGRCRHGVNSLVGPNGFAIGCPRCARNRRISDRLAAVRRWLAPAWETLLKASILVAMGVIALAPWAILAADMFAQFALMRGVRP